MRIGILGAMSEEVSLIVSELADRTSVEIGGRTFHSGKLNSVPVVVGFSHWGKVASASTATHMIGTFKVDSILFSGVAGASQPGLKVGDVVIADRLVQHDMNASPLFPRHEIPLTGKTYFETDASLRKLLEESTKEFFQVRLSKTVKESDIESFSLRSPQMVVGMIASGDKFFADSGELRELVERLPETKCVEMEGAAVAQVCSEHAIPFGIVRTISDSADHAAPIDFLKFVKNVANVYSAEIIKGALQGLR